MLCAGVVRGEQYRGCALESLGDSSIGVMPRSREGRAVSVLCAGVVREEQYRGCGLESLGESSIGVVGWSR